MRKKGGQRLLEMSRRKTPPVIEEVLPVQRYTDSDRFKKPILHDVGLIEEELPPAPPAPARQDLIGKMFPRLRAAMNLFGQIDVSRFRQARGEAGRKTFDKTVGETLLDSVLVNQLADLENRLSLETTPKNLPQIQSRLNERRLGGVNWHLSTRKVPHKRFSSDCRPIVLNQMIQVFGRLKSSLRSILPPTGKR